MFFPVFAALAVSGGISSVSAITASDLPECAVECFFQEIENAGVALTDYESQCRSAKFQLGMRACVSQKCSYDEFVFVSDAARNHCKENFDIDVKQVMISAALASESAGKLATAAPANASTSGYAANTTSTRQPSITAANSGATKGATASETAKSSANSNFDKTSWFGLIPLAGVGILFMWH